MVAASLLSANPSAAGSFADSFDARLAQANDREWVSGIVVLHPRVSARGLLEEAKARGLRSRWRVHEAVLRDAQETAARAQAPLLAALEFHERGGAVRQARPFWVTNAIALTAHASVFRAIVGRDDVRTIELDSPVEPRELTVEPTRHGRGTNHAHEAIHLNGAWEFGFTGKDRLVCTFDTGADGVHEALAPSWRGLEAGVPWYHAWFDPTDATEFPIESSSGHGTEVLGILVGKPPAGDPIGVAYDASWIAGKIRFSTGGSTTSDILSLFEWAADPDSNLSTIDDVPDVINNSWGTSEPCAETFWDAIDLVEAAGVVNVIAVANSGAAGVRSPESRADTPFRNFSVGNTNTLGDPVIYQTSGRGPSPCDGISIKPELTGPGVFVLTTAPGNRYGNTTGSSIAAPHVSGAVALLRQIDPDLEVDAIKEILMESSTDLGPAGEDNDYGWGLLNVAAAVQTVLARSNALPHPTQARASGSLGDSVRVDWGDPLTGRPQNDVLEFRVYRALQGSSFPEDPIGTVPASTHTFLDAGVPPGDYAYVVTAAYPSGESGPSKLARATVGRLAFAGNSFGGGSVTVILSAGAASPRTRIEFDLVGRAPLYVEVHDARGRLVRELGPVDAAAGTTARLDVDRTDAEGRVLASGVYFVRVRQSQREGRQRMIVLR
jgi:bacillopeptidase F